MRSGPPSWTRCKLDGPLPNTAHFKSAEKYGFPLCDGSLARGLFIESRPSDADGRGTDGDVRLPRPGVGAPAVLGCQVYTRKSAGGSFQRYDELL